MVVTVPSIGDDGVMALPEAFHWRQDSSFKDIGDGGGAGSSDSIRYGGDSGCGGERCSEGSNGNRGGGKQLRRFRFCTSARQHVELKR